MKIFLAISLLFLTVSSMAQGSWQILLNRKLQVSSSTSDERQNTKNIRSTDWKSKGYLDIRYKPSGNHKYVLQLTDESGNEQWKIDATTAKIKLGTLRKLFAGKKELKIYMILNPPNDLMTMPTRMVHLATLKLP